MDLFIAIKIWPSFYLLMIWSIWSFISIYETATLDSSTSATNQSTSIVNCRCGLKPWKNRDTDSEEPTRDCCQYFIQSKQGNFSDQTFICQIHNELVYKRFHSCCITLLQSAYCSQTRIKTGAVNKISNDKRQRRHRSRINSLIQWPKARLNFTNYFNL
uniref:Uncharacterized protein LOC113799320 n=1 Tax=Dermatophagoides pteronyssinus TaxID=6956 RepID=A0A6P6YLC6_DERPT|nr:uncharacterized protein LOC113799320 [Dermatophagoides pteronyssinus]